MVMATSKNNYDRHGIAVTTNMPFFILCDVSFPDTKRVHTLLMCLGVYIIITNKVNADHCHIIYEVKLNQFMLSN